MQRTLQLLFAITLGVLALVILTGAFGGGRYQISSGSPGYVWRVDTQTGKTCLLEGLAGRSTTIHEYGCSKAAQ